MDGSQPLLEKLEKLFHDEPFDPIEEELFKWFIFAYTGKGTGIKNLDSLSLELFKDKLNSLVDALYQWHHDKR